jgi:opacity protein-like surface antigen
MKRLYFASIVVSAPAAILPASAADMSAFRPAAMASSTFNWSGPYLGGNLGGARARTDVTQSDALGDIEQSTLSSSGIAGGGQAGYNWVLPSGWLVGFEADVMGGDLNASATAASAPAFGPEVVGWKDTVSDFGTARGRLGLAWNNWLFYGTVGYAWAEEKTSRTQLVEGGLTPVAGFGSQNNRPIRSGWAAGGGAEWGIMRNWAARVEYLHLDMGSQSYNFNTTNSPGNPVVQFVTRGRLTIDMVRGGVDFLFN